MRLTLLAVALALMAAPALGADEAKDVKGIYLLTDYPAVTVQAGTTTTVNMRLHNYGLPPERFALSVDGVPKGCTTGGRGDGGDRCQCEPRSAPRCPERSANRHPDADRQGGFRQHSCRVAGRGD